MFFAFSILSKILKYHNISLNDDRPNPCFYVSVGFFSHEPVMTIGYEKADGLKVGFPWFIQQDRV